MLCLAPIFSKGGQQLLCKAQLFFLLSQEKKGKNKNEAKWCFCSLTSLSKTTSVAGGKFCSLEHLTLQLYTNSHFPNLFQHLRQCY